MTEDRREPELSREEFLRRLTQKAQADPRIAALWLEGSLGRGKADRYSDVDLHVLLKEKADAPDWEAWLGEVRPLVLFNLLFGGAMVNAMTVDALRVDLWPHLGSTIELNPQRAQVLHSQPGAVSLDGTATESSTQRAQERALAVIREFWRCISLLPAVIGRGERLVALQGLSVELGLVTDLLMLEAGVVRDRGVKNLNAYLPEDVRQNLEEGILPRSMSLPHLALPHFQLMEVVKVYGRQAASNLGFPYPTELEETVVRHVHRELEALGIRVS